jgi:hypothetical protein
VNLKIFTLSILAVGGAWHFAQQPGVVFRFRAD